ncbi:pre-RNA processing PIH1/Nop17 [Trypanosoma brucei equiperdum]|uniref:Pre-RNA processing PIH1/Nop17 n=1 Tax=Trypanosoma brucei equiperdum TaxID=630700 RepID=A0A3L6KXU6_9TRYP|nr:pre-RNA processing PIH1/Nop17 [Trypanosoma brucei equiperdum]
MDVAPTSYLDEYGVDNLIVPISVRPPLKCEEGRCDFVIDVVVHPSLTERCVKGHRLFEHYITRLTTLAIEWILQECGVRLNARDCKLIKGTKYYSCTKRDVKQMISEMMRSMDTHLKNESTKTESESDLLGDKLKVNTNRKDVENSRSPLVTEMPASSGIQKGFLSKARLYGDKGSGECNESQSDPLLHLPENLRKKCQIVDLRQSSCTPQEPGKAGLISKCDEVLKNTPTIPTKPLHEWKVTSLSCDETVVVVRLHPPPGVTSMKSVNLEVTPGTIEIDETVVNLPKSIRVGEVSAKFLKSSSSLILTCPIA